MEGHRGTIWNHTDNMEYLKEEDSLIDNFFITDGLQSNYPHHRTLTYSFYDRYSLYDAVVEWFYNKSAAQVKYGPMNSWGVSLVDNMGGLFSCYGHDPSYGSIYANCQAFNENISSWDVSSVTNMVYMFTGAWSFNQSLSGWNVARVTDMYYMFDYAYLFNQSLSEWNVARVTDMNGMFNTAMSFNQSLSGWNVARVTDMSYMFYVATSFNQSLSDWNVARVTDMYMMFYAANSFGQQLPWNVCGKDTTDMMFGTNGATVKKCIIVPVVVGVIVPIVIIAVGILLFVILRKRRKASHKPDSSAPPSNKDTFEHNTDSKADDKVEESSGDKPSSTPMESDDSFKWKRVEIKTSYLNRK